MEENSISTRMCNQCHQEKYVSEFYPISKNKFKSFCKECFRENRKAVFHCDICDIDINASSMSRHFQTNGHLECQRKGKARTLV